MGKAVSVLNAVAWLCLMPGNLACNALHLTEEEKRDLVRMLVNGLVWTLLGVIAVALLA